MTGPSTTEHAGRIWHNAAVIFKRIGRQLRLDTLYYWLARGPGAGRRRSQGVYERLHDLALRGRGYGASGWVESGESALLARLGHSRPDLRVILDVGANVGGWSRVAARTWPDATIHAFEPSKSTHEELVRATQGLNVRTVNAALSDTEGRAALYAVTGETGLSSLNDRDLAEHGLTMTATETVQTLRLDDYAVEHGLKHIDFLKIDTEGHDLAVLKGASNLIERGAIDLIQFEFGGTHLDSRTFLRDFVRFLEPRYRIGRLLIDGVEPLVYSEREEVFLTCNFLAERITPDTRPWKP